MSTTPGFTAWASLYRTYGHYSNSAVSVASYDFMLQQTLVPQAATLVSLPCVGPNCPPNQTGPGDGVGAVPGTDCAQLCSQQYSDAFGKCLHNCQLTYPSPGQYTQYLDCIYGCESINGSSSSCWMVRNCNGRCVNTSSDTLNCGTCGHTCPAFGICTSGFCHCTLGRALCKLGGSEICADLNIDAHNCGRCGLICRTGHCCGGRCVNVGTDPNNCASCGHVCPPGPSNSHPTCTKGNCGFACNSGFTLCNGACVDLNSNPSNCGSCGHVCPLPPKAQSASCVNGTCDFTCPPGLAKCANGCFDLSSDASACGACSHMCGVNEGCCNGQCTALGTNSHCDCNTVCRAIETCTPVTYEGGAKGWQCQCTSPGFRWCSPVDDPNLIVTGCFDLQNDPAHCGFCDNPCARGQKCVNGSCKHSCDPFKDCGSGICKDVNTDPENCGQCGASCGPFQGCINGKCSCITPCGAICCPEGRVCQNGQCVCAPGLESCGSFCCAQGACCDDKQCMVSADDTCCGKGDGSSCSGVCCDDGSCAYSEEFCN